MRTMKLSVECYSGRKANERPVRFRLEERQYQVETVLDQWYGPESIFYNVRADDVISISSASRHRLRMEGGSWFRLGSQGGMLTHRQATSHLH